MIGPTILHCRIDAPVGPGGPGRGAPPGPRPVPGRQPARKLPRGKIILPAILGIVLIATVISGYLFWEKVLVRREPAFKIEPPNLSLAIAPGQTSIFSVLLVRNTGTAPLTLAVAGGGEWMSVEPKALELPVKSERTVRIGADCSGRVGLLSGALTLSGNSVTNQVNVSIDCPATPGIQVVPDTLNLVPKDGHTIAEGEVIVRNSGNMALNLTTNTGGQWWLSSIPAAVKLAVGAERTLKLKADCTVSRGTAAGALFLAGAGVNGQVNITVDCAPAYIVTQTVEQNWERYMQAEVNRATAMMKGLYAPTVRHFSVVKKGPAVEKTKRKVYAKNFLSYSVSLSNVSINYNSTGAAATVEFDGQFSYQPSGEDPFFCDVRKRLLLKKYGTEWLIECEEDIKIRNGSNPDSQTTDLCKF